MSAKKKNNEDSVVIFKQEPGQSKDDASLIYDTKVTHTANNLNPEHTPFIFQEFDQKVQDWDLTSKVVFKELWDKTKQYHPVKNPKEITYTDDSTVVIRQGEYDSVMCHWKNRSHKFLEWMSFNIHLKNISVVHSDRSDLTYLKSSD